MSSPSTSMTNRTTPGCRLRTAVACALPSADFLALRAWRASGVPKPGLDRARPEVRPARRAPDVRGRRRVSDQRNRRSGLARDRGSRKPLRYAWSLRRAVAGGGQRPRVRAAYLAAVLSIVVPIVLWLGMAWKCKAGRSWARVLSTVFFGLATVVTLTSGPHGAWDCSARSWAGSSAWARSSCCGSARHRPTSAPQRIIEAVSSRLIVMLASWCSASGQRGRYRSRAGVGTLPRTCALSCRSR